MPHDHHPLPTYSCESQDLRGNLVTSVTLKDEKVIKHIGSNCLMSYTNSVNVTISLLWLTTDLLLCLLMMKFEFIFSQPMLNNLYLLNYSFER